MNLDLIAKQKKFLKIKIQSIHDDQLELTDCKLTWLDIKGNGRSHRPYRMSGCWLVYKDVSWHWSASCTVLPWIWTWMQSKSRSMPINQLITERINCYLIRIWHLSGKSSVVLWHHMVSNAMSKWIRTLYTSHPIKGSKITFFNMAILTFDSFQQLARSSLKPNTQIIYKSPIST